MKKARELMPIDVAVDYAEIGVDRFIENTKQYLPVLDEASKEIPIVKTLVAAVKLRGSLSDFILGKKVSAFLYSSNISQDKINRFKVKFSQAKQEKLWEQIVLAINAHDDKRKSEIIGLLFTALIEDVIDSNEFSRMVYATNSLDLNNLEQLRHLYQLDEDIDINPSLFYTFVTLGLIDIDTYSVGLMDGGGPVYPLNQIGRKYTGIVFDFPSSSIANVKVGEGELVRELDKNGQSTGKAFPLAVLNSRGSRHKEIDVFIMNSEGRLSCSHTDGLPLCIGSAVVPAGQTDLSVAKTILENSGLHTFQPIKRLQGRHMEDNLATKDSTRVTKEKTLTIRWAFFFGCNRESRSQGR